MHNYKSIQLKLMNNRWFHQMEMLERVLVVVKVQLLERLLVLVFQVQLVLVLEQVLGLE
jgi:hypothetical protein